VPDGVDQGTPAKLEDAVTAPAVAGRTVPITLTDLEMSSTTRQGNGHERPDLIRGMVGRQVEQRESGERVSIMAQHLAGSVIELDEAVGLGVDQDDTVARLADDRRIDILAFAQCLECLVLTADVAGNAEYPDEFALGGLHQRLDGLEQATMLVESLNKPSSRLPPTLPRN
jgi:hypothetical protein